MCPKTGEYTLEMPWTAPTTDRRGYGLSLFSLELEMLTVLWEVKTEIYGELFHQ